MAVAVMQAPSLGTSMCSRRGPKMQKKKKKKFQRRVEAKGRSPYKAAETLTQLRLSLR